ncbi:hypothetical protein B0A68_11910 [Flavobacterium reichenbachii]|uniref:DUF2752 domain-containing protein n=1 Tax=Flavobacterium reichenbachii TaxID=362418 RepID=A0A085ZNL0_9FLAO|nr:hypothetical protein IW19_11030 [Flavobacterium reichenbachii]OXB14751.1 hypothetical protein B0A68_11910 [Flavobacterium reichenbachii]
MVKEASYKIDSYKKINVIFALLITFIFFYCYFSVFLSTGLRSSCEGLPLAYCKSRGLTRAFSQILRFNFENAVLLNPYSLKIFLFFLIQLIARLFINSIIRLKNFKLVLNLDIIFTFIFFIFSFYNLVVI